MHHHKHLHQSPLTHYWRLHLVIFKYMHLENILYYVSHECQDFQAIRASTVHKSLAEIAVFSIFHGQIQLKQYEKWYST